MELLYVWIEEYNNIHHKGFNFSPKHHFEFTPTSFDKDEKVTGGTLTHKKINTSYPDNFFGEHISNITAIVGKNGSGKSSLIKRIADEESDFAAIFIYFSNSENELKCTTRLKINFISKSLILEERNIDQFNSIGNKTIYYSPFVNANRNYLGPEKQLSEISTMEQLANAIEKTNTKANQEPNKYYNSILAEYSLQEMFLQIQFIKSVTEFTSIIDFKLPDSINLEIPITELIRGKIELSREDITDLLNEITKNYKSQSSCRPDIPEISDLLQKREIIYTNRNTIAFNIPFSDFDIEMSRVGKYTNIEGPLSHGDYFPVHMKEWMSDVGIRLSWHDLSDGEATMLSLFARLWKKLFSGPGSFIILLDEFELGLHPQWQKEALSRIINFFKIIDREDYKFSSTNHQHLILTSHSPFLVSDLPRENVIFLDTKKNNEGIPCCKVCEPENMERTFGANIHSLYRSSFFMDGLMGKFAKGKIDDVITDLKGKRKISQKRKAEIRYIIDMIGEDILRYGLERMYVSKFKLSKREELELKREEINRQLQELEKHDSNKN